MIRFGDLPVIRVKVSGIVYIKLQIVLTHVICQMMSMAWSCYLG